MSPPPGDFTAIAVFRAHHGEGAIGDISPITAMLVGSGFKNEFADTGVAVDKT